MQKRGLTAGSRNQDQQLLDRLRVFQKSNQWNKRCADCLEIGPNYICTDFGTFICTSCSGIHREFNHKVKGVSITKWTSEEVQKIEELGGNERARNIYMATWTPEDHAEPEPSKAGLVREIIQEKYIKKRWVVKERPVKSKDPAMSTARKKKKDDESPIRHSKHQTESCAFSSRTGSSESSPSLRVPHKTKICSSDSSSSSEEKEDSLDDDKRHDKKTRPADQAKEKSHSGKTKGVTTVTNDKTKKKKTEHHDPDVEKVEKKNKSKTESKKKSGEKRTKKKATLPEHSKQDKSPQSDDFEADFTSYAPPPVNKFPDDLFANVTPTQRFMGDPFADFGCAQNVFPSGLGVPQFPESPLGPQSNPSFSASFPSSSNFSPAPPYNSSFASNSSTFLMSTALPVSNSARLTGLSHASPSPSSQQQFAPSPMGLPTSGVDQMTQQQEYLLNQMRNIKSQLGSDSGPSWQGGTPNPAAGMGVGVSVAGGGFPSAGSPSTSNPFADLVTELNKMSITQDTRSQSGHTVGNVREP